MQSAEEILNSNRLPGGEIPGKSPFREIIRGRGETENKKKAEEISIIIVEDDSVVSMALEMALSRRNYHVSGIFKSGLDAIEAVKVICPDVVLMDIMLDGELDGIQTARIISDETGIPVIYLTASEEEQMIDRLIDTNHFGFLIKPFQSPVLYAAIEIALYRTRMEKELRESEERYATTLKSIGDAVLSFNEKGEVNYINPSALSFLDTHEEKALGKKLSTLLRQIRDEQGRPMKLAQLIASGKAERKDLPPDLFLHSYSRKIPVDLNISFTHDHYGKMTGGVIVFRDITHRKEEEIKWANLVVGAQETDRRKISENLHESLAQILSAIRLNFTVLENQLKTSTPNEEKVISRLKGLLDTAMDECRDVSQHLSPKVLVDFGLEAALAELCLKTGRQTGLITSLKAESYSGTEKNREMILFRIAQELVENVLRHSGAEILKISLIQDPIKKTITLQVTDNGQGFDEDQYFKASVNSGFKNIQNRIVLLGGKSYIRTSIGKGTSFQVVVPS